MYECLLNILIRKHKKKKNSEPRPGNKQLYSNFFSNMKKILYESRKKIPKSALGDIIKN